MPEHVIERCFVRQADSYRVIREVRERIIFAEHNITRDAPFTQMDYVSCRNVLIYMQTPLQRQILTTMHSALRFRGTLFLGAAETLGDLDSEFVAIDRKHKIWSKRRDVTLPPNRPRRSVFEPIMPRRVTPDRLSHRLPTEDVLSEAMRHMLAPKRGMLLVLGDNFDLIHAAGNVSAFLRVPEGASTTDVTEMVPKQLTLPLRTAIHRAMRTDETIHYSSVELEDGGETSAFVSFKCWQYGTDESRLVLVVLEYDDEVEVDELRVQTVEIDDLASERIAILERELQHSRENLQATIEELETTNEEQQATNEELLASNEELQSTNEELQSVNEELYTVNAEYQSKIQELTDINNDMDNFLASTKIGAIFLDVDLNIRKFTPEARLGVNVLAQDVGRPLGDISHNLISCDLGKHIEDVVSKVEGHEFNCNTSRGLQLLVRIYPYLVDGGKVEGVVLTFVDIGAITQSGNERSGDVSGQ